MPSSIFLENMTHFCGSLTIVEYKNCFGHYGKILLDVIQRCRLNLVALNFLCHLFTLNYFHITLLLNSGQTDILKTLPSHYFSRPGNKTKLAAIETTQLYSLMQLSKLATLPQQCYTILSTHMLSFIHAIIIFV